MYVAEILFITVFRGVHRKRSGSLTLHGSRTRWEGHYEYWECGFNLSTYLPWLYRVLWTRAVTIFSGRLSIGTFRYICDAFESSHHRDRTTVISSLQAFTLAPSAHLTCIAAQAHVNVWPRDIFDFVTLLPNTQTSAEKGQVSIRGWM